MSTQIAGVCNPDQDEKNQNLKSCNYDSRFISPFHRGAAIDSNQGVLIFQNLSVS